MVAVVVEGDGTRGSIDWGAEAGTEVEEGNGRVREAELGSTA